MKDILIQYWESPCGEMVPGYKKEEGDFLFNMKSPLLIKVKSVPVVVAVSIIWEAYSGASWMIH